MQSQSNVQTNSQVQAQLLNQLDTNPVDTGWILQSGLWNDDGVWQDGDFWNDGE